MTHSILPGGEAWATALEPSDSLQTTQSAEETLLYEIKFARIQRLVNDSVKQGTEASLPREILDLISEAKGYARQGDYLLANDFLEDALDYIEQATPSPTTTAQSAVSAKTASGSLWSYQAFMGSDLWQQKFGLVLADKDSAIYESQGNPFFGFRLLMDNSAGSERQTQAELEAKTSHDYNSGQILFNHQQQLGRPFRLMLENRLEGTAYKRNSALRYVDDRLHLGMLYTIAAQQSLEVGEEIQLRSYQKESDYFNSFLQNQVGAKLNLTPFARGMTTLSYDYRARHHRAKPSMDYQEQLLGLEVWPSMIGKTSLYARLQSHHRSYRAGYVDSLFTNGFTEIYGETNLRYSLSRRFAFRLEADLESRTYKHYAVALPNYLEWMLEPSLTANVSLPWSIKLGYRLRSRHHSFSTETATETANLEDYYSHGPVCTVDVFAAGGFLATLSHSFEFRRFPNAPYEDGAGLSLYSNRNIHSLFLFLTWNLSEHWELSGMGNLDYDDDRNLQGSDSRTNLFNIELSYKF